MAVIKCKMCGGDLVLVEGQSVAECEYCGSRQTVPSSDNEKKLIQFERAERLRKNCEFDKAAGLYEAIVSEFRQEAEAYWGMVLCKYGIEYVDDPATGKKIPTCHRSSFDSILEDSDFEQALENADSVAWRVYREEAKQIEQIRKGIIAVSANEAPYDVFICYKETDENGDRTLDSVLAQDIYDALTEKGYRTFFARITLEDKLGQEYEPYIFAALNSAKIMLAVGTDYEFYNAVWVKNEWSRYLKLMTKDKTKHLIPCFKGIDAYDMPREFAKLQAQDMGKVGAMQDLLRGIEKILPKQKNTTVIQEKVVVGAVGGNNKVTALLERGNMALEDGDWAKADSFFEDVLNNDAKNAQAYIGKTLAQEKCRTMDTFARKRKEATQSVRSETLQLEPNHVHINEMAQKYSLPGYVEEGSIRELYRFALRYSSEVSDRKQQYREEENYWANHKLLSRAEKFASGAVAQTLLTEKKALFAYLKDRVQKAEAADAKAVEKLRSAYGAHIAEADQRAEKVYNDGLARRERDYQTWLEQAKKETFPDKLKKLAEKFAGLGDYQDSKNLAEHCRKRAAEEQAKIDAEEERQRVIAEQRKKAQQEREKRLAIITVSVIVAVIAIALIVTKVILPGKAYKEAEALLVAGDTYGAAKAFGTAGTYRDAWERSFSLWGEITNRETVSANDYTHIVGICNDGSLETSDYRSEFYHGQCDVDGWTDIVAVSAGSDHTVGLRSDGTVVATEYIVKNKSHYYGQCDVDDWRNIVAISAASTQTVGLRSDGTVVATTYIPNSYYPYRGQCDVSDWTDMIAVTTHGSYTVGLHSNGTVVAVGENKNGQCDVDGWTNIVAVDAGSDYTVGLRSDGTVVAVGLNDDGQCEVDSWADIVAVSAGFDHTVGLRSDGTVVAVGGNKFGQCDVRDWEDIVAVSAGSFCTVGLRSDGTVVAVGSNNEEERCDVSSWTNIKLPVISEEQRAAMDAAKQEQEAQLAAEQKAEEERLAREYAAAEKLAKNGETAKAAIAFGKLADYKDSRERSMELWNNVDHLQSINVGESGHTVALKSDGTVVAVGKSDDGRLDVQDWKDIVSVSAGAGYTVGLKSDGTVLAIGYDDNGRCDVEDWQDIISINTGLYHTVGIKSDGTVVAAGTINVSNSTESDKRVPNVGSWKDIVKVCGGKTFTLGLRADGTVVSDGSNYFGQCNVTDWENIVSIDAGEGHSVGVKADGTVVAVGYNIYGQCNVQDWKDIVSVCAGKCHTVGLKSDGTVVAIGWDKYGQCDVSEWKDIVAIDVGASNTVGIKADGTVIAIGWDEYGQCDVADWKNIKLPQ